MEPEKLSELFPREREPWVAAAVVYAFVVAAGMKLARAADLLAEADGYAPLAALPTGVAVNLLVAAGLVLVVHVLARLAGPWGAALAGGALMSWGIFEALSVAHHRVKGGPITWEGVLEPGHVLDLALATPEDRVAATLLFCCAGLLLPALLRTAAASPWLRRAAHPGVPVAAALVATVVLLLGPAAGTSDLSGSALLSLLESALAR